MKITIKSTYRKATATVIAKPAKTKSGHDCLRVSRRAFLGAEAKCSYAGDDGVNPEHIERVPGYYAWQRSDDGGLIAFAI